MDDQQKLEVLIVALDSVKGELNRVGLVTRFNRDRSDSRIYEQITEALDAVAGIMTPPVPPRSYPGLKSTRGR